MGILVTPKSQAEVNQLVSVLHSANFKNLPSADPAKNFKVGVEAIIWANMEQYCHERLVTAGTDFPHDTVSVNELYTLLRG